MLTIDKVGMFHIGIDALCVNKNSIGIIGEREELSSLTFLAKITHAGVHDVAPLLVFPSILQMQLLEVGRVMPTVTVLVHVHEILLIMCQHLGAQVVVEMDVAHGVALGFKPTIGVEVEQQSRFIVGF